MQTKFFIESPPLAGIFAECEWMDWISKETMMMAMMIVMMMAMMMVMIYMMIFALSVSVWTWLARRHGWWWWLWWWCTWWSVQVSGWIGSARSTRTSTGAKKWQTKLDKKTERANKVKQENRKKKTKLEKEKRKNWPKQTQDWARMGTEDWGKKQPIKSGFELRIE